MKDFSYRDGRNTAPLRLEALDQGLVFEYGHGPEKSDFLGAREVWVFEADGLYHMTYDGAGPLQAVGQTSSGKSRASCQYTLSGPRTAPVAETVRPIVQQWLQDDQSKPRKQRHTQTRIYERLRDEYQFTGSRRTISTLVNKLQGKTPEVFCPIDHPPAGEVQIDWGQATVMLAGEETKVMIFCARSAYSKATFVRGSVERYDADGKHLGTFISGLLHGWEGQRMDRRRIVYNCVDGSRGIVYNCDMTITQSNKRQTELASTHSRLTLADHVVERIRNEIISGVLAPGTMLAEIPTAQRLEVSRVPVREAFRELEHDGLLVFEANGRCHVQTLTARDFDEIYNVRLMLETESFRLAALNHSEPDLKALRNNIRQMERARSLNRMTLLDIEFHDQVMEMSRQSRLIHIWGVMRSQVRLFTATLQREISSMITNVRDVSVEAHVKCVSGIESRDPDLARQCAIEHLGPWSKWLKTTRPEGGAV